MTDKLICYQKGQYKPQAEPASLYLELIQTSPHELRFSLPPQKALNLNASVYPWKWHDIYAVDFTLFCDNKTVEINNSAIRFNNGWTHFLGNFPTANEPPLSAANQYLPELYFTPFEVIVFARKNYYLEYNLRFCILNGFTNGRIPIFTVKYSELAK